MLRFPKWSLICFFLWTGVKPVYSATFIHSRLQLGIKIYRQFASPIRANHARCNFYPSCSHFAEQVFDRYGFVSGTLMTGDRLMRCHSGLHSCRYWGWSDNLLIDLPSFEKELMTNWRFAELDDGIYTFIERSLGVHYPWFIKAIRDKEYDYTIAKLKDLYYSTLGDSIAGNILYVIGWILEKNGNDTLALDYYHKAIHHKITHTLVRQLHARIATLFLKSRKFMQIQLFLDHSGNDNDSMIVIEKHKWKVLCLIGTADYSKAQTVLSQIATIGEQDKFCIDNKIDELKNVSVPAFWLGVSGAVLPGSGYLLAGESGDAFSAFITNALLIGGTVQLIKNKSYLGASFLGLFTLPFYLGNIYGGIHTAKLNQINENQKKVLEAKIILNL